MYVKEVAPEIRSMIHDQLRQVKSGRQMPGVQETSWTITIRQENLTPVQLVSLDEPSAIMTKLREPTKGGVDYTDHNLNVDTLPPPYSEVERAWVKQLAADLKFNHDNFQDDRKERIGLIREACTWILEKREYKNFVASTHNAILFIEGGPGFGKSSLAKFLTSELAQTFGL
jgi:Cdc6-like AAA superfamily ATPase